jgi:hypothetical protein
MRTKKFFFLSTTKKRNCEDTISFVTIEVNKTFELLIVIGNYLLSSAYPGAKDSTEHLCMTRAVYNSGIEVYVNLMEPTELTRFTPYQADIQEYANEGSFHLIPLKLQRQSS